MMPMTNLFMKVGGGKSRHSYTGRGRIEKGSTVSDARVNGITIHSEPTFKKDEQGRSIMKAEYHFEDVFWGYRTWVKKI